MDLTPYVEDLREKFAVAAETGGEDARALAERLMVPLESAVRLALLDVLSGAMDEVTRDLAPGSVEVRLRGLEPAFVVTPPPGGGSRQSDATMAPPPPGPQQAEADDTTTARINLRLPGHLKARAEEAASRAGVSLNTWLVRAVGAALEPGDRGGRHRDRDTWGGQRYTGWVR
ncbi:MAG TPA: toxin-antitoxin system HicB family antitoxin [Streptosporangiaceae bacterium]